MIEIINKSTYIHIYVVWKNKKIINEILDHAGKLLNNLIIKLLN